MEEQDIDRRLLHQGCGQASRRSPCCRWAARHVTGKQCERGRGRVSPRFPSLSVAGGEGARGAEGEREMEAKAVHRAWKHRRKEIKVEFLALCDLCQLRSPHQERRMMELATVLDAMEVDRPLESSSASSSDRKQKKKRRKMRRTRCA